MTKPLEVGTTVGFADLRETCGLRSSSESFLVLSFLPTYWDPARTHQLHLYNSLLERLPDSSRLVRIDSTDSEMTATMSGDEPIQVSLVQGLEHQHALAEKFGVEDMEAVFVLDDEGMIRWRHLGPLNLLPSSEDLLKEITRPSDDSGVTRRQFVGSAIAIVAAMTLLPRSARAEAKGLQRSSPISGRPGESFHLEVNGTRYSIAADPRTTLLDALRERIGLTGTKKGCDHGQCGACTVHVEGRRVNSCLTLAASVQGQKITTVEGLARGSHLHPVQEAFIKHDGFQCGYCTPGQIMSAVACIEEGHTNSDDEIREWMSGNICRCGAYPGICAAIKDARTQMGGRA